MQCSLVVKQSRGNRTNIYLVYPPEYYCEKIELAENVKIFQGVEKPPSNEESRVSTEHPESIPETPSECRENTLRVATEHPISTSTKTRNKSSSTTPAKNKEREPAIKEICPNDIEAVQKSFKNKGFRVNDAIIIDYLGKHDVSAIKGAIFCTDFEAARNPLAVISANLSTGKYVIPAAREAPITALPAELLVRDPGEEEAIMQLREKARESLLKKTRQSAQA